MCVLKVYLNRHANPRKKLLVPCALDPPNPKCYVCAARPEIALRLNVNSVTVKLLEDKVTSSLLSIQCFDLLLDRMLTWKEWTCSVARFDVVRDNQT